MASTITPVIVTFKASGAIAKGSSVKMGSDDQHVSIASAATDKQVGIAQSAAAAAEDLIEIAVSGGGAKAISGGTIARGDLLTSNASGALVATTTALDRIVGVAMSAAASGDIFSAQVQLGRI
jgi:translation elongation factor EF-1alpha